jgi:hypothetical protein
VFGGGTELGKAVERVREIHGDATRILAVTDVTASEYANEGVTLWMPSADKLSVQQ